MKPRGALMIDNSNRTILAPPMASNAVKIETEEELLHSRAELRAIYDIAPVMMCVVDEDRRVVYANAAFIEFTGIPEAELQGGSACGVFGCINALEDPKGCGFGTSCKSCGLLDAMEDTLKTGQPHLEVEYNTYFRRGDVEKEVVMLGSTALIKAPDRTKLLLCLHDISDRTKAENKIKALLSEKELMLKETHHRIKNNMSVIHSLLNLQAAGQENEATRYALKDAAGRVQSMMTLYEKLYRTENQLWTTISGYLGPLVTEIIRLFDATSRVRTNVVIEDFMAGTELLSPLGIIINELVTNSLKYAFRDNPDPFIQLRIVKQGSEVILDYYDNGVWFDPEGTNHSAGFGLQLIGLLTQQIDGQLTIERNGGTRYVIRVTHGS
jgi:two-component sensor histidine kinase